MFLFAHLLITCIITQKYLDDFTAGLKQKTSQFSLFILRLKLQFEKLLEEYLELQIKLVFKLI